MKFQCDRCKTRYSIADERVRGKILKIRCKNCSAVITVREQTEGAAEARAASATPLPRPAPRVKAGSALQGAFQDVISRPVGAGEPAPSASDSFRAPDHFEQEWYVSCDGVQSGPFSLAEAKDWVAGQGPDDELHCWNEDFDDWLPVEKVSHFRGVRSLPPPPAAVSPAPAAAQRPAARSPRPEDTPKPLFGPTLAALEAEQLADQARVGGILKPGPDADSDDAPGDDVADALATAASGPMTDSSAGFDPGVDSDRVPDAIPGTESLPEDADGELDFEIGEASRMVKLPMLMAAVAGKDTADTAAARSSGGLPGVAKISSDTGSQAALAPLSDGTLADAQPEILAAGPKQRSIVLPLLLGTTAIAIVVGGLIYLSRDTSDGGPHLAKSRLYGDELSYRHDNPDRIKVITREVIKDNPVTKWRTPGSSKDPLPGRDDGGAAVTPGDVNARPLTPNDVLRVSSQNSIGNRRCYENALKKDPFLDVKSIKVTLTVAPSGVVTKLEMSSYANTFLGQCLQTRIRKWAFRKSPSGITTQLTLSFEQS